MVDKIKQKAMKIALIVAVICFFTYTIIDGLNQNFLEGLLNGILGGLIFGGITFLISKSAIKNKINLKWWQWIFYVIGCIGGFINPLFWLVMAVIHQTHNYGYPFFSKDFHRRTYIWGIVVTILIVIFVPLVLFLI